MTRLPARLKFALKPKILRMQKYILRMRQVKLTSLLPETPCPIRFKCIRLAHPLRKITRKLTLLDTQLALKPAIRRQPLRQTITDRNHN